MGKTVPACFQGISDGFSYLFALFFLCPSFTEEWMAGGFFTTDSLGNPQRFRKVYGLAVFLLLLFFGKYSRKMVHKNLFLHISHYINAWLYPTARKSENKSLASHVYSAKNFILAD